MAKHSKKLLLHCRNVIERKKIIVQHLAQTTNLLPKTTLKRVIVQIADKLKLDVHNFYICDDISYQLPGRKDTVVAKADHKSNVTY